MIKAQFNQLKNWLTNHPYFSSLAAAILCFTSYPPFPAWAIFFCFIPVWTYWYKTDSIKKIFWSSFLCQFVITLGGFYWVAHTAWEYGHIPVPLNILVLFAFCAIANLYVVAAALCTHWIRKKLNLGPAYYFFTIAFIYALFELTFPTIFPWNLGYPLLYSHFKTAQLAEFFGFNFISLFVLLMNALLCLSFFQFPNPKWSRPLFLFVILFAFTELAGTYALNRLPAEDKNISVLMVQTNMGSYEKYWKQYGQSYQVPIIDKLISLTKQQVSQKKPDLVVWPENAFPDNLDTYFNFGVHQQHLLEFIKKNKINLVTGAFSQDPPNHLGQKDYSAIFALNQNADVVGFYRKTILLAFGEYIPGAKYFPFLNKLIPEISELGRGAGPMILNYPNIKISPIICYEALYSSFVTDFANLGSQVIVNATNDSWYGDFSEQFQHLTMAVARSVELRKPLIRVTNTGFSAAADIRGHILAQSPRDVEWAQTINVPYYETPYQSLYSKIHGYLPLIFSLLVVLMLLIDIIVHVKKRT